MWEPRHRSLLLLLGLGLGLLLLHLRKQLFLVSNSKRRPWQRMSGKKTKKRSLAKATELSKPPNPMMIHCHRVFLTHISLSSKTTPCLAALFLSVSLHSTTPSSKRTAHPPFELWNKGFMGFTIEDSQALLPLAWVFFIL